MKEEIDEFRYFDAIKGFCHVYRHRDSTESRSFLIEYVGDRVREGDEGGGGRYLGRKTVFL